MALRGPARREYLDRLVGVLEFGKSSGTCPWASSSAPMSGVSNTPGRWVRTVQPRPKTSSVSGAVHDREFFRQSGATAAIPKETVTGGDAGYQGIQDDLPDHSVITPFKKTKLHPLSEEQKLRNQDSPAHGSPLKTSWPNSKTSRLWLNAFVMILTAGMMSSERC